MHRRPWPYSMLLVEVCRYKVLSPPSALYKTRGGQERHHLIQQGSEFKSAQIEVFFFVVFKPHCVSPYGLLVGFDLASYCAWSFQHGPRVQGALWWREKHVRDLGAGTAKVCQHPDSRGYGQKRIPAGSPFVTFWHRHLGGLLHLCSSYRQNQEGRS